jgi:hypothetical protein
MRPLIAYSRHRRRSILSNNNVRWAATSPKTGVCEPHKTNGQLPNKRGEENDHEHHQICRWFLCRGRAGSLHNGAGECCTGALQRGGPQVQLSRIRSPRCVTSAGVWPAGVWHALRWRLVWALRLPRLIDMRPDIPPMGMAPRTITAIRTAAAITDTPRVATTTAMRRTPAVTVTTTATRLDTTATAPGVWLAVWRDARPIVADGK